MLETCTSLEVEEIGSGEGLERLTLEWASLWQRCPNATPFQHPDWLIPWWRHFGADKALHTFIFRDCRELVGIAPLCILSGSEGRKVMPVGIGLSDTLDQLSAPGYEEACAQEVFAQLALLSSFWDICELQPLLADSLLLAIAPPEGITSEVQAADTLTSVELTEDCQSFWNNMSRHFCDRVKDAIRRAEKLGQLRFKTATRASFDSTFECLLRFHENRWRRHSHSNEMNTANLFHREAASAMLERGALRLYSLNIGDQIVAALYGFMHQRRGYLYMTGFDPAFYRISPGLLLMVHVIEEMIQEHATVCDFLRGREAYKYRWRVLEQSTYARQLYHER